MNKRAKILPNLEKYDEQYVNVPVTFFKITD